MVIVSWILIMRRWVWIAAVSSKTKFEPIIIAVDGALEFTNIDQLECEIALGIKIHWQLTFVYSEQALCALFSQKLPDCSLWKLVAKYVGVFFASNSLSFILHSFLSQPQSIPFNNNNLDRRSNGTFKQRKQIVCWLSKEDFGWLHDDWGVEWPLLYVVCSVIKILRCFVGALFGGLAFPRIACINVEH